MGGEFLAQILVRLQLHIHLWEANTDVKKTRSGWKFQELQGFQKYLSSDLPLRIWYAYNPWLSSQQIRPGQIEKITRPY